MSDYEAEARYEHATTLLDWGSASETPPDLQPPSDDPGWMLFSQNPARSSEVIVDGVRVERFLCVWRRRLTRVEQKKPTRAESVDNWKAKKRQELKEMAALREEQDRLWRERQEAEKRAQAARVATRLRAARLIGPRIWSEVKGIAGVRALGVSGEEYERHGRWYLIFEKGVHDRHEKTKIANDMIRRMGIVENEHLAQLVHIGLRLNMIVLGSNDPSLPVSTPVETPAHPARDASFYLSGTWRPTTTAEFYESATGKTTSEPPAEDDLPEP